MMFQIKERKIILISLLSLLVAVVTFGVLGSSGAFKNSVYDLGGAIVGFVITAYLLNRFYGKDPGEIPEHELKGAAFLSAESVKILDMRNQKPAAPENKLTVPTNRVVLTDHYRLKKLSEESVIKFPYATTGYGMEGRCLSRRDAVWYDRSNDSVEAGEDKHLRKQYELELDVEEVAKGEIIDVHNDITYINAFEGKEKEWFHTHVNIPTQSLTIILLFPATQRCDGIKGFEHVGRNKSQVADKSRGKPIVVDDQKMVYWHIPQPRLGASYKLEWEWQYKAAIRETTFVANPSASDEDLIYRNLPPAGSTASESILHTSWPLTTASNS